MTTYPKSPKEMTRGMMYFPRMLDKIRQYARGELHEDYHKNLGTPRTLDGACCNFLRVNYDDLRERVLQGGTDEEILEWCFNTGRRLNEGTSLSGMHSHRNSDGTILPLRCWRKGKRSTVFPIAPIFSQFLT